MRKLISNILWTIGDWCFVTQHKIEPEPNWVEVVTISSTRREIWDEGYRACLRQWDNPPNADRMPERNPY